MNRRTFLKTGGSAAALFCSRPAWTAAAGAPLSDDELLAQAREGIARHRRGLGAVVVRGADGKPLPGAKIHLEQVRHDFLFGCNLFGFAQIGSPDGEAAYRERFADLLNFATLGFYWAGYEKARGQTNHAYMDQVLGWASKQGITCKGHPLVWDHPAGAPRWLPEEETELERLSNARVREIVTRFKGRIDMWDVVNEATHLPQKANQTRMSRWGEALGNVKYTRVPLEIARAANPSATLLVNDYRTDEAYFQLLEALRDTTGKPLYDAVGIQSHMHDGGWPLHRIQTVCDRYAQLRLPVHFTEATVVSGPRLGPGENWGPTTPELEARQADYVPRFYTMLFGHPALQAITWWDFSDHHAWQRAAAGLIRADMSPKPVYDRLTALIKGEWWTRVDGITNADGECAVNAFFGQHRVTVTLPGERLLTKQIHWAPGKANRVELVAA